MATALETAILNAVNTHGAAVADRNVLANVVSGGSGNLDMVHGAIIGLTTQGKLTVSTSSVTGKPIISKGK